MKDPRRLDGQTPHSARFVCFSWACGHWTAHELSQVRSLQLKMTRRIAHWFPLDGEPWPEYARRCAAWSRRQWREAGIPHWDQAICAGWWRWAGHAAHLDSDTRTEFRRSRSRGRMRGGAKHSAMCTGAAKAAGAEGTEC